MNNLPSSHWDQTELRCEEEGCTMLAVFISDLSDTLFTFTIRKVEVKKPSTLARGACAPIHL